MDTLTTKPLPVGDLTLYHRNPRRGNIPVITESLNRLGQYRPIVVNTGTHTGRPMEVLAGNHTLLAARQLGWETIDAVTVDVDDDQAARIVLVDNRSSDLAHNDDAVLAELLSDLPDLSATGYSDEDLEALLAEVGGGGPRLPGDPDEDDVPEPPADPVAKLGDLWELGPHRLLCGDGTDGEVLARLLDGAVPDIVHTDPPYGLSIVNAHSKIGDKVGYPFGGAKNGKQGSPDAVKTRTYLPVTGDSGVDVAGAAFKFLSGEFPEARHVWWGGNHYAATAGLSDSSCWLIWDKETNGDFADAELAWTNHPGSVRRLRHMWNGMLRASERGKRVHPTQKPVALAVWVFGVIDPDSTRRTVLDTFAGSGSTLLAAHQTDRQAFLTEVEPHYIDVICTRWQNATGIHPTRDGIEHDFSGGD